MISNDKLEALNNLSPEEKALAIKILQEYAQEGDSYLLEELKYADFEEIPVDIETFMHDRMFLGNGLYDAEGRFTVYPFWEETLKDIFPDNLTTKYNTVVLTGAIGIGKSFVAVIAVLYMLYRLLCLKDPYTFYGMQPIDKLSISFMNITLENAKGVALDKMNQLILSSEWFMAHGEMTGTTNLIYRPEKHIEFVMASSNNQIIGRAIIANFSDEVNFSLVRNPEVQKDRMMKLITQLDARMRSRFMRGDYLPTLNIIASSKDTEQSFLDAYIKNKKENNSTTTLVVDKPQWVVDNRKDTPEKFWVAIGNKLLANELLPLDATNELIDEFRNKGYQMWQVPMGYLETFQLNLDESICSIIGIATASTLKFISGNRLLQAKTDSYKNPFTKEVITVGNAPDDHLQYANFFDLNAVNPDDFGKPLFIHLDMSMSGDRTGIAGVWITGRSSPAQIPENIKNDINFGQQTLELRQNIMPLIDDSSRDLRYKLAFSVGIEAPKGYQVSFEKNRNFIRWLRDQGFAIKGISSDTFQSATIQQELKADGFNTQILSVDRVDAASKKCLPYEYFKSAIYERRVQIYNKCDLLTEEITNLERLSNGKVEHPDGGKHGCFTGDTKVKLVDGRDLSFLELVDEYNNGKQNFVYSINLETEKIEPKQIKKAWCTLKDQPLVKITLDNGEEIKCTLNHKIMLRNGVYIEAQDLLPGDSLMPLYTRYSEQTKMSKYRQYYEPFEDKWHYEHRQFATEVLDEKYLVHHKDCNPQNNNPTNLVWCSKQKHQEIHNQLAIGSHSPEVNAKRRQSIINWYADPTKDEIRKNKAKKLSDYMINIYGIDKHNELVEKRKRAKQHGDEIKYNAELRKQEKAEYISEIEKMFNISWNNLTLSEKDSYSVKYARAIDPTIQKRMTAAVKQNHTNGKYANADKALQKYNSELKQLKLLFPTVDTEEFENFFGFSYETIDPRMKGVWNNRYRKKKYELLNHSVVSIEFIDETADVYDIEVEDNHNFALSAGIFVHNSKDISDAFCGSLYLASKYSDEYSYYYGDNLSATINANTDTTNNLLEKQKFIEDLENNLLTNSLINNSTQTVEDRKKQEEFEYYKDLDDGIIIL